MTRWTRVLACLLSLTGLLLVASSAVADDLSLTRQVIATEVDATEPVGIAESFDPASTERVLCWMEFANGTGDAARISVRWQRRLGGEWSDHHVQPVAVQPGPETRTWARARVSARRTGEWRCVAEAEDGTELGTATFTVVGEPEADAGGAAGALVAADEPRPAADEPAATDDADERAELSFETHDDVAVREHSLATGVDEGQPQGVATQFSAGAAERVYCFVEAANRSGGELPVLIVWSRKRADGSWGNHFEQPIRLQPGLETRTWAKLRIEAERAGVWKCALVVDAEVVVSEVEFQVTE